MIGETISHYRILEKLGEGGMGVVYKAEDMKLGRTVALKFLAPHLLRSEEALKRFEREARAAASLDHPNICTIHEIDESKGRIFIVLAFVEGQSLAKKVTEGPLAIKEVLSVGAQLAEGLAAAHEHGVVHRDIKPDNVMLLKGSRGLVKIMDFGLAQLSGASNMTRDGTTLGTMAYMSPEQAEGGHVDHRSDIWALGAVLYEMTAGRPPFKGDFDQAVVYSILNEPPEPLTGVRTGVPQELERIVNKCLAKDAESRYQHVDDVRVDLDNLVKASAASGSRIRAASQVEAKRGPKWLASAAVAAVLIAAGIWYGFGRGVETGQPAGDRDSTSVAIMPFVNASGDADFEYFADGMTDELISALSQVEGLRVVARSSVFRYKGERYDLKTVAAELGVANVLEGTVRREGDRLRINTQLISAEDGFELWSERLDRQMEAVFDIQDELASEIAKHLRVELAGGQGSSPVKRPTENVEAYASCLRGEFEYFKLNGASAVRSVEHFERALKLDPDFARAHAGLARAYTNIAIFGVQPTAG